MRVQKTKEEEKSKNWRQQGERRKIVPKSQNLFLFLSFSPVPSRNRRALLATSILNNSREKRSKFHRYDASLYNKKVLSADNFFSLSLSFAKLIYVLLSTRTIEEQKLGERGRRGGEKNGFARRRGRKRAHNTYRWRDSFHGHGGKHFCFKFLLCALYEERKNSLAV